MRYTHTESNKFAVQVSGMPRVRAAMDAGTARDAFMKARANLKNGESVELVAVSDTGARITMERASNVVFVDPAKFFFAD